LIINYGHHSFKTRIEKKTLNPVWTEQVFVIPQDSSTTQIVVECWDWNLIKHAYMGEFVVPCSLIPDDGSSLQKFFDLGPSPVKDKKKKSKKEITGGIELQLSCIP